MEFSVLEFQHGPVGILTNAGVDIMSNSAIKLLENNIRAYVEVRNAYDECSLEIRAVVDDMLDICRDPEAAEDERDRAISTIIEAMFPSLAADLRLTEQEALQTPEAIAFEEQMDREETGFAENVRKLMKEQGLTQEALAARVAVGQPAISNMLNRQCRPQRRTVLQFAEALGVTPRELWPSLEESGDSDGK
jgi:lambda repressor-like predicted transcriptional regulator